MYRQHTFSVRVRGRITNTLQKWERKGILRAQRSPTNRRYYTHDQYVHYHGSVAQEQSFTIVYSRVFAVAEKPDLAKQINVFSARLHGLRSYRKVLKEAALHKE